MEVPPAMGAATSINFEPLDGAVRQQLGIWFSCLKKYSMSFGFCGSTTSRLLQPQPYAG